MVDVGLEKTSTLFNSAPRSACVHTSNAKRAVGQQKKGTPSFIRAPFSLRLTTRTTHHHFQIASVRRRLALAHGTAPCEARHRSSLPDGCGGPDRSRRDHESGRLGDERHEACHESESTCHRVLLVLNRPLSSKPSSLVVRVALPNAQRGFVSKGGSCLRKKSGGHDGCSCPRKWRDPATLNSAEHALFCSYPATLGHTHSHTVNQANLSFHTGGLFAGNTE